MMNNVKKKNTTLLQIVTHHCQNPLDFNFNICYDLNFFSFYRLDPLPCSEIFCHGVMLIYQIGKEMTGNHKTRSVNLKTGVINCSAVA
jgi:hypothetical protein